MKITRIETDNKHKVGFHFWRKVQVKRVNECWEWQGNIDLKGYGDYWINGSHARAHRIAFLLAGDEIEINSNEVIEHICDNRSCCNPKHLRKGDYDSNNKDRVKKGRSAIGINSGSSKLTDAEVIQIRDEYISGKGVKLSKKFGVSTQTIYDVVNGKYWKHLPLGKTVSGVAKGEKNNKAKVTEEIVKTNQITKERKTENFSRGI